VPNTRMNRTAAGRPEYTRTAGPVGNPPDSREERLRRLQGSENLEEVHGAVLDAVTAPPSAGGLGYGEAILLLRGPNEGDLVLSGWIVSGRRRETPLIGRAVRVLAGEGRRPMPAGEGPLPVLLGEGAILDPVDGGSEPALPGSAGLVLATIRGSEGPLGLLLAGWDGEGAPTEDGLCLLDWWCRQGGIALERTDPRRGRRAEFLGALQEMAQRCSTAGNLPDLLGHMSRLAAEAVEADGAAFWLPETGGAEDLEVVAEFRRGRQGRPSRLGEAFDLLAAECFSAEHPLRSSDDAVRALLEKTVPGKTPPACLFLPIPAAAAPLGVLGVTRSDGADPFRAGEEGFFKSVASQASLAVTTARSNDERRRFQERLRQTELLLRQSESLASLGEMSARMIRELRAPLSAIARRARKVKGAGSGDLKMSLDEILGELRRLDGILDDYAGWAVPAAAKRVSTDLNALVQSALELVKPEIHRAGAILEESLQPSLPLLLLDTEKVGRVLLNILRNALENVDEGDTIRVETHVTRDKVALEVAHTGERGPGEILERLFVPFATGRVQGHGLGLGVSQQVIKEHGGEIQVRSDDTWSVVVTLSLPIAMNRERRAQSRRSGRDRRSAA